jgi:transcription initiation factor TFIIIB Brf1 subunit/transcription initiation factor TFIIB
MSESEFEWAYRTISTRIPISKEVYDLAKSFWEKKGLKINKYWAVASFYTAIKISHCYPIVLKDFVELFGYQWDEWDGKSFARTVSRYYHILLRTVNVKPKACYINPDIYVKDYGEKLGFDKRSIGFALRLTAEVRKRKLHIGRKPNVVSGAILYIVSLEKDLNVRQTHIASLVKCREVAIRDMYKMILKNMKDYCPKAFQTFESMSGRYKNV